MKNLKQIIFASLLVVIMLTTVAVSVFADTNLALEDLQKIVEKVEKAETAKDKEVAIRYAILDFKKNSFDSTAPGYDELMARFYAQNTLCAMLYLDEFDKYEATGEAMTDANAKYALLNAANRLLSNEYAPLASNFDTAHKAYFARHILVLGDFVATADGFDTYEDKGDAIDTLLKYLETHIENFTEENYNETQLASINALLVATGDECVEFVDICQSELEVIEKTVNNRNNPLNKANAKREILDEAAEIMNNDYAKLSEKYEIGAVALTNISFTLVKDLADVAELTEIPDGVKSELDFTYLKNAILIDIDQIIELGYCESAEGFDAYLARKGALDFALLTEFINILPTQYTDYDTAQLHFANSTIKQVRNLLKRYFQADESEELKAQLAIFEERCALFDAAYDKYIVYRDNLAPLSDYEKSQPIITFDGTVGLAPTPNGLNSVSGIKDYVDTNGEVNQGIYFQPEGKDFYTQFSSNNLYNTTGVIFEFDITTFDDEYLANVWFNHGSTTKTATGQSLFPPNFMGILSGGELRRDSGASSPLILEHVITPGEWTRIALAYDASKCTYSIYVDGIIAEEGRDAKINGTITWYLTALRVNSIRTDGEKSVVMDNFAFYQGTALRTYDRYKNMSDEEKFAIYSDIYSNENMDPPVRLEAYELGANALIANYYNSSTNEYLTEDQEIIDIIQNRYLAFDYDKVLAQYQEQLIFGLKERVDVLKLIERGFSTISTRTTTVSGIEAYITSAGSYMPKNNTYTVKDAEGNVISTFSFATLSADIEATRSGVAEDTVYKNFCAKMFRYQRASTSVAKKRYYNEATQFREDALFNTSVVNNTEYNPANGVSGSLTLSVAWNMYLGAAAEIDSMVRKDNAEVIVKCVETIKEYDTVEEWAANFEYVNGYVMIMREIINSGEYDENYEGFAVAKRFYDDVNAYCYSELQKMHVEILTAELDKFPLLTTYIEKLGFCLFIDDYLADNDIDYDNPDIKAVIERYEIYIADIGAAEKDYELVLEQNTIYFVNLVNELQTCVTFEDIRAKLNEASLYLHTMNNSDPAAERAIEIYERYDAKITGCEEALKQFTIHTTLISTCITEDEMFETLVNCNLYRKDVQEILEAVSDDDSAEIYEKARTQLALYDAAYAVYNARISGTNLNITAALKLLGTLRDPAEIDNAIANMLTLMEK